MKITKSLIASAILASSMFAGTTDVVDGWNLKGASSDINATDINCAKAIWTYNAGAWGLYVRSDISNSTNYGYSEVNQLNQGQGFWVLGESCTNSGTTTGGGDTSTVGTSSYYNAFGRSWEAKIKDTRYVDANVTFVAPTETTGEYFTISADKKAGAQSRADIQTNLDGDVQAVAKIKLIAGGSSASARFRLFANNVNYNGTDYAYAFVSVDTFPGKIRARLYVQDSSGNTTQVSTDPIEVDISNFNGGSTLNQKIKFVVKMTSTGIKVIAKDDSDIQIGSTLTLATTGFTNYNGFDFMILRANVDDSSSSAADMATFNVFSVDAWPVLVSSATTQTVSSLLASGTTNYLLDNDSEDASYDKFDSTGTALTTTTNDYNGTVWLSNTPESATLDLTNGLITFTSGAQYEMSVNKTVSIDDLTNVFLNNVSFKVTQEASTFSDGDYWDWDNPSYNNGSTNVPVTDNSGLLTMFLVGDNYFNGSEDPAMLSGNVGDTSGDIVRGVQDGYQSGCTATADNDCKKIVRTSTVIGSWSVESDGKIVATLLDEYQRFSIENVSGTYKIKEDWKDRLNAIFNERMISGTIDEASVRSLLAN